ncbi:probable peptidyl-tRNA hydrolase isoform X1 [Catharus ustulatus]|uniref:probable peptidyl-tRNA hydrolase isoform X1 n=1 Tax=Catharus ustulatus TaxID=91951 RepID=UPI00140CEA81|nr:probable peptidyl-tRNA hydrolase isoform X1 [Catharus ustulatus]
MLAAEVAGLGNYGLWGTRHSVGMEVLDRLARQLEVADRWRVDKRCCADVTLAAAHGLELVLLKPRRFMNLNGLSIASAAEIYSLGPGDIYLVHDDLDKALGKVAIKLGGSARGHNGVQSCISAMHSNVSGPQWKGISPVPPSMHGLFPHSRFHDSPQTNLCSVPPFSPSPSSQRAVVFLAAMEDMETISLSGSARPGRSLGSRHSSAKASSKIMFLGASTQNHLENMRSCSLAAQSHSQYCHVA